MRYALLPIAAVSLVFAACVDTTGLSEQSSKSFHPKSNPNAAVTVVEYADLQCPACKAAQTAIVEPLLESHGTKIRYEYRHFPLRSLHRFALDAAEASECTADQGKFWEFVAVNFEKQADLSVAALRQWANDLKIDMTLYDRCVKSHIKKDAVMAEYDAGKKLGVQGTPTFFVNGQRVESDLTSITKAIDEAAGVMRQKL